jgi:hypothetical protein
MSNNECLHTTTAYIPATDVLLRGDEFEVIRIAASTMVTLWTTRALQASGVADVIDLHTIGDQPLYEHPYSAGDRNAASLPRDCSHPVAVLVDVPRPHPAADGAAHLSQPQFELRGYDRDWRKGASSAPPKVVLVTESDADGNDQFRAAICTVPQRHGSHLSRKVI